MMGSIGADVNPIFGIASIPFMGFSIWHALPMNAREVLAANFQKLREATPTLSLPKDIVKAGAATNGTIGRITKKEIGPSIDTVEKLASAYGLQAWQMLSPALHVSKGRNGKPAVETPGAWPFELVDRDLYERLSPVAQGAAQMRMMDEIRRLLGDAGDTEQRAPGNGTDG